MAEIIQFPTKEVLSEQYGSGEAFCISCKYTWVAVAPTGTEWLECPKCERSTGKMKYPFCITFGLIRVCGCGNELFYITPSGHLCPNCGIYQKYD